MFWGRVAYLEYLRVQDRCSLQLLGESFCQTEHSLFFDLNLRNVYFYCFAGGGFEYKITVGKYFPTVME